MNKTDKIAILGLGREGLDLLRFFHKMKIKPIGLNVEEIMATDPRYRDVQRMTSRIYWGKDYLDHLDDIDLVFRSPGVPLNLPAIKTAKKHGVQFSSLTQLFFDACPAKIIGITGTKGKSTTASLVYHLLKGHNKGKTCFGGNIGYPPLMVLNKLTKQDIVVFELSSFQLEDLMKSPHIAVMLMVSPEHLDRHKTYRQYLGAKLNVVRYQTKQDFAVVNIDDKLSTVVAKATKAKVIKYSVKKILSRGVYVTDNEIIFRDFHTGRRQVVMPISEVALHGQHNLINVLAAITTGLLMGVAPAKIRQRMKRFTALEHRLEPIGHLGQVEFINDSMATTPVATMAALQTVDGNVGLILGGASKQEDFNDLVKYLSRRSLVGVVLIGQTSAHLHKMFKSAKVNFPVVLAKDFPSAVKLAYGFVKPVGTVILSPACASFGWFKDAYDRGNQFKLIVKDLIGGK
ncbi:UDP-N-acetylmuramoyl-L-alanine--D-glutamate ligase [Patescibacteria group bacterium]|nr:UDP-N-acetylmuramoyl-L-alanine--D-glutamate ligase [Patescibacteria group bacterium]